VGNGRLPTKVNGSRNLALGSIGPMDFGDKNMNQPEHDIVRIGISGARIMSVSHQRIDYIDMAGHEQFIDLPVGSMPEDLSARLTSPESFRPFVTSRRNLVSPRRCFFPA
jgi:hypothetical protein